LKVGDTVPGFTLPDENGDNFVLQDVLSSGKYLYVVVFFYPKDFTPGCTTEVCSFRDSYAKFAATQTLIVGISADDAPSHQSFVSKYKLPFHLLCDAKGEVSKLLGVSKALLGLSAGRKTYLLDPTGKIIWLYEGLFTAGTHVSEALKKVEDLQRNGTKP